MTMGIFPRTGSRGTLELEGTGMGMDADAVDRLTADPVSNILKWVLLLVAIGTFAGLGWATWETYRAAPPQPDRYVTADGAVVMTNADIVAGKAGFQRADLM